jgi:hypothetical protein
MLSVAITGTLSVPRKEAAALIDSTSNARFHPDVSYQTNYLVAARFNSGKARKAAQIGVTIITEVELMEYVKAGRFPETNAPTRPPHVSNFPEIDWLVKHSPGLPYYLEYEGSDGVITPRYVMVVSEGRGDNGQDYIGAFDGEWFKTFRRDRFRTFQRL